MRRREPLPRRGGSGSRFVRRQSRRALNPGKRLLFRVSAKSTRFKTRQAARTTRRMSESGPSARFPAGCPAAPQKGQEGSPIAWTGPLPHGGGSGFRFACRQSGALQNQTSGMRRVAFGVPPPRGVHAAAAEFGGGAWAPGSTVWTGTASPQGEAAPVLCAGKVGALQNQASGAHNAPNLGKGLGQAPQSASGSRFLPHSALRSTSSPSGPCAICWKPAFSYRRTGPA